MQLMSFILICKYVHGVGQKASISIKIHPIPNLKMINRQIASSRYTHFLTTIINQAIIDHPTDFIFMRN